MYSPPNRRCGALSTLLAPLRRPAPRDLAHLGYCWLPSPSIPFFNLYVIRKTELRGAFGFYFRRCGEPYGCQDEASALVRFGMVCGCLGLI